MEQSNWIYACKVEDMPHNGGVCILHDQEQIALYYFTHRQEWYATQNLCPHKKQMALSRGMLGSEKGEPKVACPFHKKTFSLQNGQCLNDEACDSIRTYPVKIQEGGVYINLSTSNVPLPSLNNTTHDQNEI